MRSPSGGVQRSVIVVGAGMGGLACAVDLARQGVVVDVFESAEAPGGKIHQQLISQRPIDSGPTVITMPWVFEDLLHAAGKRLSDYVELHRLPILARHAWDADQWFDLHDNPQATEQAIAEFAGGDEAARFVRFSQEAKALYARLESGYMRSSRPSLWSMSTDLGPAGLALLASIGPMQSLWKSLGRHFKDARLRQLFARYATYCGGSPWQAPATLMLIAYVEMRGVWQARGGMQALGNGMAKAATDLGARIHYEKDVVEILVNNGRASGVRLASGEELHCDAVVFNGDVAALYEGLLGKKGRKAVRGKETRPRSLSALTWAMTASTDCRLDFHNVFFQSPYEQEFKDIFDRGRLPRRPTIYVCAQDRGPVGAATNPTPGAYSAPRDASADNAAQGDERLFLLINAPAKGDAGAAFSNQEFDACTSSAFSHLSRCGLRLDPHTSLMALTTPVQFHRRFPATGGALYGRAPHGWTSVFHRPSAQSHLPGLFLAGGSVHPGAGVPMAALSGRLAAATLMAHLDSISSSSRVVISGGMSMG